MTHLVAYVLAVLTISFIHEPAVLLAGGCLAFIAAGEKRWQLLRRSLRAIVFFNLSVSLGYTLVAAGQGNFQLEYVLLVNSRVLLLVFLGFCWVNQGKLLTALRPFPLLRLLATLAISQSKTLERLIRDFRLAFRSRNLQAPTMRAQVHHAAAQAQTLFEKSLHSAHEAALAMRSRGTFEDEV